jgi:inner membrane protein
MGHQIVSKRITGKVGRKITTRIDSVNWVDEEILPKLEQTINSAKPTLRERYPDAMMHLTGSRSTIQNR